MLFLFWFIRIVCVVCFFVNLIVVDIHNIPSFLFFVFGGIAAFNIYLMGLLAHETYKSLPSLFILFRTIQLLLMLSTKCNTWHYIVLYVGLDIFVFALYVYDNKYAFMLKERDSRTIKTQVTRYDLKPKQKSRVRNHSA